jgi:hypothetical protein
MGLNVEITVFIEYDIRFGKKFQTLRDVSFDAKSRLQIAIRIDIRISRIEQIGTDFFIFFAWISSKNSKKIRTNLFNP